MYTQWWMLAHVQQKILYGSTSTNGELFIVILLYTALYRIILAKWSQMRNTALIRLISFRKWIKISYLPIPRAIFYIPRWWLKKTPCYYIYIYTHMAYHYPDVAGDLVDLQPRKDPYRWCKMPTTCDLKLMTGWWYQIFVIFDPYLGKIPKLTSIFQRGWNHQPDDIW